MTDSNRAMIPLSEPDTSGNEAAYLQQCIDENALSNVCGFVDRFETELAKTTGATQTVAVSSGTSGIHLALSSLGVEHGDLVIVPSFTFIATANAVSLCGATPWLLDIDANSWTLCPKQLEEVLRKHVTHSSSGQPIHNKTGQRIGAIVPVYTLGCPADMDTICALAKQHGIPVVADAAAAIGALYKNAPLAQTAAHLTVLSFNGNKTITTGAGGAVVGQDQEQLALCKHLSTTARSSQSYDHDMAAFNYRMSNLQAAVGCAQLERLDHFLQAKQRHHAFYQVLSEQLKGTSTFPSPAWATPTRWLSGLRLSADLYPDLQPIRDRLRSSGVDARPFWKPLHLQKPYQMAPCEDMPVTDALWPFLLPLPCSVNLSAEDRDYTAQTLQAVLG